MGEDTEKEDGMDDDSLVVRGAAFQIQPCGIFRGNFGMKNKNVNLKFLSRLQNHKYGWYTCKILF